MLVFFDDILVYIHPTLEIIFFVRKFIVFTDHGICWSRALPPIINKTSWQSSWCMILKLCTRELLIK